MGATRACSGCRRRLTRARQSRSILRRRSRPEPRLVGVCRPGIKASVLVGDVGAARVDAVGGQLEHAHGTAAHPVTTPAKDDGVYPPGQDPLEQYLALFLVEEPADEEVHQARRSYHGVADNAKESRLRVRQMTLSSRAARMKSLSVRPRAAWVVSQMVSDP